MMNAECRIRGGGRLRPVNISSPGRGASPVGRSFPETDLSRRDNSSVARGGCARGRDPREGMHRSLAIWAEEVHWRK